MAWVSKSLAKKTIIVSWSTKSIDHKLPILDWAMTMIGALVLLNDNKQYTFNFLYFLCGWGISIYIRHWM
jgi:hypothetical protein